MKPEVLLGEVECPHGRLPREVELATMNGDQSSGEMVLGYLDSVLKRDVARSSGMLGGKLPAPASSSMRGAPRERRRFAAHRAPASARIRPREVADRRGVIADRDQRDVGHDVLQPGLARLAGQFERPCGLCLSLLVAHSRPEVRKHGECSHPKRVIVETLCELERRAGALWALTNPSRKRIAEASRIWMSACSTGLDSASRRASSSSVMEPSIGSRSARTMSASARSAPVRPRQARSQWFAHASIRPRLDAHEPRPALDDRARRPRFPASSAGLARRARQRGQGASVGGEDRGLVESRRDLGVRLVAGQRQVARPNDGSATTTAMRA